MEDCVKERSVLEIGENKDKQRMRTNVINAREKAIMKHANLYPHFKRQI